MSCPLINMVSRGISAPDILRGIHESMAGKFARLLGQLKAEGTVFLTGGLANDVGLHAALREALETACKGREIEVTSHPDSIHAGALGAAIWGAVRHQRLGRTDVAWTRQDAVSP